MINKGEFKVISQVLVSFTLGGYKDEVLCYIIPMHADDMLLGLPSQYDRDVAYDGLLNTYAFTLKRKKFTLLSLSPCELQCDQFKLEKKRKKLKIKRGEKKIS